jgi:hypothetical protein
VGARTANGKSSNALRHGHAPKTGTTKTYNAWMSMLNRCTNRSQDSYYLYGGRGITVCDRWLLFDNFLQDMGEPPSREHSLDRMNSELGYFPANCRWALPIEQANNKRNNVRLAYAGKSQTIAEWARESGMPYDRLWQRIKLLDWSVERALTEDANPPAFKTKRKAA